MARVKFLAIAVAALLAMGCGRKAEVPGNAVESAENVDIFPDYKDVTIPPNIAPPNFRILAGGDNFVAHLQGGGREMAVGATDGTVRMDTAEWAAMAKAARGGDISVTVYVEKDGGWTRRPSWKLHVAREDIDRYLSYRLIEPSYELYRQLGLYQRDLHSFEQYAIIENNRTFDEDENHCVNCHNFQAWDTKRMLFHVRGVHGGTVVIDGGDIRKVDMKTDSTLASAVYPSWHHVKNWVVFSTNKTGQVFHTMDKEKVEVVDYGSDLMFYDADNNTLTNIFKTDGEFETFPCWTPDGKAVYYCRAEVPQFKGLDENAALDSISAGNKRVRYDVMRVAFDEATRSFGTPETVVACAAVGKSASVPRVSPDGRYLLYTLADHGQFHIWHRSSDLWVKDLVTGDCYPLEAANSPDVDSYHSWSSNGRWIVFASRRIDGSYTRAFIAYFGKDGRARKAFLLPQEDPVQNTNLLKSYNVPELSRNRVPLPMERIKAAVYDDDAIVKVKYKP